MVAPHFHTYNIERWPEGHCTQCPDIGNYPPVAVTYDKGRQRTMITGMLEPSSGPVFWCQVCGSHFMTRRWAQDHIDRAKGSFCPMPYIVQLRQEA